MLLRVCLFTALASVSIAQLTSSCTTCSTNSNYGSSYGNQYGSSSTNNLQRDDTGSSSNQPGYLPDYQGDRYTDPQRIAETQALNRAFFESIGGAPSPPPETPAQQGMNGGSTAAPNNGSTSTTYSPTSSAGYNTQYYNPSPATQNSQTGYRTGSTGQMTSGQNQNFVAYDSTNQNSPYYYQRVPSTAQYNSILGVNAGFPQGNQVQFDQGSTQNQQGMNNQQMYNPQSNQQMYGNTQNNQGYMTQLTYTSISQNQQGNNQMYANQAYTTQGYGNQPMSTQGAYSNQPMYDQSNTYSSQGYGSSTPSPQYNADAISCCSQVSSTCCYQTQSGGYSNQQAYSNQQNVQYSPSVYQYGKKR